MGAEAEEGGLREIRERWVVREELGLQEEGLVLSKATWSRQRWSEREDMRCVTYQHGVCRWTDYVHWHRRWCEVGIVRLRRLAAFQRRR